MLSKIGAAIITHHHSTARPRYHIANPKLNLPALPRIIRQVFTIRYLPIVIARTMTTD